MIDANYDQSSIWCLQIPSFAITQSAYDDNCSKHIFIYLDQLEEHLCSESNHEFCWLRCRIIRRPPPSFKSSLFVIFEESMWFQRFKCNIRRIIDFPNLYYHLHMHTSTKNQWYKQTCHIAGPSSLKNLLAPLILSISKHQYFPNHTNSGPHRRHSYDDS